ncbi:hypothetical protein ACFP8W_17360, partial [Nocardioides hankookensis]
PATPRTDLLDWQPVDGSVDDTVTRGDDWTLTVADDGSTWRLQKSAGVTSSGTATATPGWQVSDTLLDDDWAVVVLQDEQEQRPGRATVTNLESGKAYELNGRSDVPTTNGGTWALGDDRLVHATYDRGAYCLAEVDLASQKSTVAWCAPKRQGFNAAHVTDAGISVLSFDDSQPSCRTVVTIDGGDAVPFTGPADCKAWEGLVTDDGAVWSTIPREQRIEEAEYVARVGDGYFDLGPGVAGSLTECDGAAYFVRDPEVKGGPAALMRWTSDDGLSVVYESPKGQAFVEAPRCGGDTMTLTARTSSGDQQVTADLG